jgi:uncharacterized protein (TIGR00369 family)
VGADTSGLRRTLMWPETYDGRKADYSTTTVGMMIDESFSRVVHQVRPRGRSVVTSELSVDLVDFVGQGVGSVRAQGEVLAASEDSVLARSVLTGQDNAIVAGATSWCLFLGDRGDDEPLVANKPPSDLSVKSMVKLGRSPDADSARAEFRPDSRCGNDLDTLHGGIAIAATLEVAFAWLGKLFESAAATSIRTKFVRPMNLEDVYAINAAPVHLGRRSATTAITTIDAAGKLAMASMVTGSPATR